MNRNCDPHDHTTQPATPEVTAAALERTARIFRALGDTPRLRILHLLQDEEWCVSEIVRVVGEKFSTVSQRLRLLRTEGLVRRRRDGSHLFYSLADRHVADLVHNALAHAAELEPATAFPTRTEGGPKVTTPHTHTPHDHTHRPGCGHTALKHDGHVDYLHDGHLHHPAAAGVEEHALGVGGANPDACTPGHACGGHPAGHKHGPGCGHEAVPHGGHVDYLVDGHLHHPHGDHCDSHGPVQVV